MALRLPCQQLDNCWQLQQSSYDVPPKSERRRPARELICVWLLQRYGMRGNAAAKSNIHDMPG